MGTKIILVLVLGHAWIQATTAQSCSSQMDSFRQCVRNSMSQDRNDPTASDSRRQQMQSDFSSCAAQNGCQNPYPPDSERQARGGCLSDARNSIRLKLQSCVQSQYRDFQMPGDDNDKDSYWNYIFFRTFAAMRSLGDNRFNRNRGNKPQWQKFGGNQPQNDICGSDDNKKNRTLECLKSKGTFSKTSSQSNWRRNSCSIRSQCNKVSQQCQDQWNTQTKPRLCDCVSNLKNDGTLRNIQDQYLQCLRSRGVRNVDQNDDGRLVIQRMLNTWCGSGKLNRTQVNQLNQTDPCRRQRGRGNGHGNGNGNGRGNGNGNGGGNWHGNGVGNNGNGGSGSSWNGNGGGSNWNGGSSSSGSSSGSSFSGSSSSSSSSNSGSPDYPYDDGTPAQAPDANPFSGMLGGTDTLAAITGGSSSSSSSSSSNGGGGFLSSFTGGGSPLSGLGGGGLPFGGGGGGLLSSFTGGGGGGDLLSSFTGGSSPFSSFLGGGGSPLDLFTGGGSLFDPSSLTSSMGAFGGGDLMSGFGGDSGNILGSMPGFS